MLDNIFDYVTYLERRKMIGQLHSWNSLDQTAPIIGLLVPLDVALNECSSWSGQDLSRFEFVKYLRDNGVQVYSTLDDFVRERDRNHRSAPRKSKRLMEMASELDVSKERIQFSNGRNRFVISGKNGCVHEDESNPSTMHIYVIGRSKRHWSSIKRKMSFTKLLKDGDKGGMFGLTAVPTSSQATTIRNVVGMSKSHTITAEHKERLQGHAAAIREHKGAISIQLA